MKREYESILYHAFTGLAIGVALAILVASYLERDLKTAHKPTEQATGVVWDKPIVLPPSVALGFK